MSGEDAADSPAEFGPDHPLLAAATWATDELSRSLTAIRAGAAVVMTVATAIGGVQLSRVDQAVDGSWGVWAPTVLIGVFYLGALAWGFAAVAPAAWSRRPDLEVLAMLSASHPESGLRRWLAFERVQAVRANRLVVDDRSLYLRIAFAFTVACGVIAAVSAAAGAASGG